MLLRQRDGLLPATIPGLTNAWEETCVQIQGNHSFYWDAFEETVGQYVELELEGLAPHEVDAIWLQTPNGESWDVNEQESRKPNPVSQKTWSPTSSSSTFIVRLAIGATNAFGDTWQGMMDSGDARCAFAAIVVDRFGVERAEHKLRSWPPLTRIHIHSPVPVALSGNSTWPELLRFLHLLLCT